MPPLNFVQTGSSANTKNLNGHATVSGIGSQSNGGGSSMQPSLPLVLQPGQVQNQHNQTTLLSGKGRENLANFDVQSVNQVGLGGNGSLMNGQNNGNNAISSGFNNKGA